jgi:hypothetical protein
MPALVRLLLAAEGDSLGEGRPRLAVPAGAVGPCVTPLALAETSDDDIARVDAVALPAGLAVLLHGLGGAQSAFLTMDARGLTVVADAASGAHLDAITALISGTAPSALEGAAACVVYRPGALLDLSAPPAPEAPAAPAVDPKAAGKAAPAARPGTQAKKGEAPVAEAAPPALVVPEAKPAPLVLVFGGATSASSAPCADLHAFRVDEAKPAWVRVTLGKSTGPTPGARSRHSLTAAASGSRAVLFGGFGQMYAGSDAHPALLNDAWVLNCVTWTWSCLLTSGIPPAPRAWHASSSNSFLPDVVSLAARPWQHAVTADLRTVLPVYRTMASALGRHPGEDATEADLLLEETEGKLHGAGATPDVVFIFGGTCAPGELAKVRSEVKRAPSLKKRRAVVPAAAEELEENQGMSAGLSTFLSVPEPTPPPRADDMTDGIVYALVLDEALAAAVAPLQPGSPLPPPPVAAVVVEEPVAVPEPVAAGKGGKAAPAAKPAAAATKKEAPVVEVAPVVEADPVPTAVWTSLPAVLPLAAAGRGAGEVEGALLGLRAFRSTLDSASFLAVAAFPVAPLPLSLDGGASMPGDSALAPPASAASAGRPSYRTLGAQAAAARKLDTSLRRFGHSASSFLVTRSVEGHEEGGEGASPVVPAIGRTHSCFILLHGGVTDSVLNSAAKRLTRRGPGPLDPASSNAAPHPPAGVLLELLPHDALLERLTRRAVTPAGTILVGDAYDAYGGFILRARSAAGLEIVRRSYPAGAGEPAGVYEGESDAGVRTGTGKMVWNAATAQGRATVGEGGVLGLPGPLAAGGWTSYEGEWAADAPHGVGTLQLTDGRTYLGSFVRGECAGQGALSGAVAGTQPPLPSSAAEPTHRVACRDWPLASYTGDWSAGRPCGDGELRYGGPGSGVYTGTLGEGGLPQGEGTLRFALEGERSVSAAGTWVGGVLSGPGASWWLNAASGSDLEVYKGPFVAGMRSGLGAVVALRDGSAYEGAYTNGRRNGQGVIRYATGDAYRGKFVGDQRQGAGSLLKQNGDVLSGLWAADKAHGECVLRSAAGTEVRGVWAGGVRQ